ncbi:GNAT family N-acetyltransferase [Helicobacter brantae]|uniref:N-acetyltransferase domain-containing protein n=1 Tax=Helicobacter brantae TaxID=375927 RepID=A0A3D8IXU5_9HELI|nr:bifunctional UDP-2,4-diacetamido-2,4,6-trideoxy-beta-L-altropyranose hydrolase/GNAT family N-acetyltransferase [Helicobacter brantae]RDU69796.1 hypothetical protein CQA58_06550 [Helicobacter brantae]
MRVDLFCESGERYGLGHLRRCENLFLHLKAIFPTIPLTPSFHSSFSLPPYPLEIVIIDSYITPKEFYESIECQILICLDDFFRIPYPKHATILSPTLGAKSHKNRYGGEGYVILNPLFLTPPKVPTQKGRILVNLGGSRQDRLLDILTSTLKGDIHIINPYYKSSKFPTYSSLAPSEICTLIDSSEIIITAGGGGLNEALSRGKKIIALLLADNQLSQLTHAHSLPSLLTIFSLKNLTCKLTHSLSLLYSLPTPSPKALGYRLDKLLYKLLLPLLSPSNALHFSLLSHTQKLEVLKLRNQKEVRENSLNPKIISTKEHFDFIASLTFSQFFWAFFEDERCCGEIVAVGSLQIEGERAKMGIYKNMKYKGVGEKILHSLYESAKKLSVSTIEIEVLRHNSKALHLYKKSRFSTKSQNEKSLIMEKNL